MSMGNNTSGEDPASLLASTKQQQLEKQVELHVGILGGTSDDISAMIDRDTCASSYYLILEECLGENERNWSKCQKEVKMLKLCTEALKRPNK